MPTTEMLWKGMRATRAGRREDARAVFQTVLRRDPTNNTALVWLGYLANNPQDSIAYITRAMEAHPQNPRTRTALQWAWRRVSAPPPQASPREHKPAPQKRFPRRRWAAYQVGLTALVMCLMATTLIGWAVNPSIQAAAPAAAAMASAPNPPTLIATALPTPSATPADPAHPSMTLDDSPLPSATPAPASTPTPAPAPPDNSFVIPAPFPTMDPDAIAIAAAIVSYTLPIPTPVQPVPVAAGVVNIAVLGSDQRADWSEWHTDVVQIVSIQRDRGSVSVISVPRDIYLYIPNFWMSRINFADFYGEKYNYEGGGPALIRDTLLYNLGIRVDYFARTNFDGLIGIVDTVGGVDIPVHCPLSDHWPYPDENGEYPILAMEPGLHHMDGETALWYARSRKTTSVFSRERRQQQVLQAIWHEARNVGILTQVPALWTQGQDMVETDLAFTTILDLAQTALTLKDQNVRFYNIGAGMVTPWTTPYGGAVFLPQWEKIQPMLAEAMAPVPEARMGRTYKLVEVWNGTSNQDWDSLAVDRLYRSGFPAVAGKPDRRDYAETQLVIFSEHVKGTGAGYLQQMFQIPDSRVIRQPDGSSEFGFRLILGADYQTCP
ncbi:MAG TPA: hypothetical protein G4N99_06650 [Thermoflexia bacterium]|nr:hypothetical protein [Thermoflexia bacterium]